MFNLFRIFDPSSYFGVSFNWVRTFIFLLFFPPVYWRISFQIRYLVKRVLFSLYQEFQLVFGKIHKPGSSLIIIRIFIYILINNVIGLFPYIFTSSSRIVFCFRLVLPLWLGHVVYSWVIQCNHILAHLVPLGTPVLLIPLIVILELLRRIIRPLTLSVRLGANLTAGHLLITLIAKDIPSIGWVVFSLRFVALFLMVILERVVALLQAYVFSILNVLYVNECSTLNTV